MNTTYIIVSLILAGIFDAVRDSISQYNSLGLIDDILSRIIGRKVTWFGNNTFKNKYLYTPAWLWTTILVFLTDSWHFFKYLTMYCIFCAIGYAYGGSDFIILSVSAISAIVYMSIFEIVHSFFKSNRS